jgi:hypothetical protein
MQQKRRWQWGAYLVYWWSSRYNVPPVVHLHGMEDSERHIIIYRYTDLALPCRAMCPEATGVPGVDQRVLSLRSLERQYLYMIHCLLLLPYPERNESAPHHERMAGYYAIS